MVQKIHPRRLIWGAFFPPPVVIFSKKSAVCSVHLYSSPCLCRCRQLEMCVPNSFLKGGPHFSKSRNHEKLKSHPKWLEISNKYFKKLNSFFFDLVESNDLNWQDKH